MYLDKGVHRTRKDGMCLMEAVAYVAGEPHTHLPECVCPVITKQCMYINDVMTSEERNALLKPFVPLLVGTYKDEECELRRKWVVYDVTKREYNLFEGFNDPTMRSLGDKFIGTEPIVDATTYKVFDRIHHAMEKDVHIALTKGPGTLLAGALAYTLDPVRLSSFILWYQNLLFREKLSKAISSEAAALQLDQDILASQLRTNFLNNRVTLIRRLIETL